ncbi:hypothetical protein SCHPADRAFT_632645 [Schizopora paradoxa]|uniref:NACHT domain-containing protein n=1 Tax=Schizopora paradoxa TaxID=27342 RepID=A0A0H2R7H0_9AGAM|nr:hypothetical protein SCHPADRAFT_632645 [Schizopora paradoxa]
MVKFSFRQLSRRVVPRFRRRGADNYETVTEPGNTAGLVVNSQDAANKNEEQEQEQELGVVDGGHGRDSQDAATKPPDVTPDGGETNEQVESGHPEDAKAQGDSKHLDKVLDGLTTVFRTAESVTKAVPFPGSDIIFNVLASIVENVKTTRDNKETKERLLQYLSKLRDTIFKSDQSLWPVQSRAALDNFNSEIVDELKTCTKFEGSRVTGFIFAKLDKDRLSALEKCISRAASAFQIALAVEGVGADARIEEGINIINDKVDVQFDAQALREVINGLPKLATYDSQRPRPIDVCYGDTCNTILEEIKAWAVKDGQPQIMWISGLAGTGKSTIAKTIATWAAEEGILGGNYFFSRDMMELRKSSHVIPTIAYHLSAHDDSLTMHISKTLVERNGHVLNQEIAEQFRRLIEEPLRQTYAPTITRKRTLLIVDGMDECDNPKDVEMIIHRLSSLFSSPDVPNAHIRILLVSRPERHIRAALLVHDHDQRLISYSVEDFVKASDIEDYLRNGFVNVGRGDSDWPSKDDFSALVESCGKLFIYASTVLSFIGDGRALRTPEESLQIILNVKSDGALDDMPYKQLDDLYSRILLEAVGNNVKAKSERMVRFRKILGTIVLLRDPLGVSSLSKLIEEKEQQIWNTLKHLGSILIVPPEEDFKTPVRFFHPSLLDHLIDVTRCNERFFIDVPHLEAHLFQRCVDIIVSKGLLGTVVEDFIPVMCYVCQYWGYHLGKVDNETVQVMTKLDEFVRHHLLKWFRFARILLRSCDPLFRCMEVARNWASDYNSEVLETLDSMLRSSRVLDDGFSEVYASTYDAARSTCGVSIAQMRFVPGYEDTRRATCHPGTRVAVLDDIKEWTTSESTGPTIFWLHGSALTGKSAVAMSIAEWADEKGFLCGGFFFRDVFKSSELGTVICTISHDLASFNISMRGLIVEALEDLELQFEALIAKPLLSLRQDSSANQQGLILLIVDGLEWFEGATEILTLFFTRLSGPDASHIRILITSRSTPNICNAFEEYKGLHKSANLDEAPVVVVRKDIEIYLHDGLVRIHKMLGSSTMPDWPKRNDLDSLVNDSRNSFLYAKYALKFFGNPRARNSEKQLQNWLLKNFDGESFEDMYPHWVAELGAPPVRLLIVAICISKEPLPLVSLAKLLQTDTGNLRTTLPHLYPFIVSDADADLRASHSSLRDFCMNSELLAEQHAVELCCHCLRIMNEGLSIVFENPNRKNKTKDERDAMFTPGLRYACKYWATILSKAIYYWQNESLSHHFDTFVQKYLLSWLYAVALLQLTSESASMMHTAYKWSQDYYHSSFIWEFDTKLLTEEAWHFAEDNHQAFAESPLQVYRVVLDLPEDSELRDIYKEEAEERLRAFGEANDAGAPDGDIPSQS